MTYWTYAPQDFTSFSRRGFVRRVFSEAAPGAIVLALAVFASAWILYVHPDSQIRIVEAPIEAPMVVPGSFASSAPAKPSAARSATARVAQAAPVRHAANVYSPFIDPSFSLNAARASFAQSAPLASTFGPDPEAASPSARVAAVPTPPLEPQSLLATRVPSDDEPGSDSQGATAGKDNVLPLSPDQNLAASAPLPAPHMVASVPLPAPRPAGLEVPEEENHARVGVRQAAAAPAPEQTQVAVAPPPSPKHKSFFDKLFGGLNKPSGQVLAYAEPEDGVAERTPRAAAVWPYDRYTAVYDIAAHTVYLPDGRRLEAHSGLGAALDNPHYVRERMRGPTPPDVYDLKPREQLFHGVPALRLIPVGNGDVFGRTGLLAHTFMLGPRGDSNGCVSFRNYAAFLRAYREGEVRHLAVVAGLN